MFNDTILSGIQQRQSLYFRESKLDERKKIIYKFRSYHDSIVGDFDSAVFKRIIQHCMLKDLQHVIKMAEKFEVNKLLPTLKSSGLINYLLMTEVLYNSQTHLEEILKLISVLVFRSSQLTKYITTHQLVIWLCRSGRLLSSLNFDRKIILLLYNILNDSEEAEKKFILVRLFNVWEDIVYRNFSLINSEFCLELAAIPLSCKTISNINFSSRGLNLFAENFSKDLESSAARRLLFSTSRLAKRCIVDHFLLMKWNNILIENQYNVALQVPIIKCLIAFLNVANIDWMALIVSVFRMNINIPERTILCGRLLCGALKRFPLCSQLFSTNLSNVAAHRALKPTISGTIWLEVFFALSNFLSINIFIDIFQQRLVSVSPPMRLKLCYAAADLCFQNECEKLSKELWTAQFLIIE